jgi:hypothetical protein
MQIEGLLSVRYASLASLESTWSKEAGNLSDVDRYAAICITRVFGVYLVNYRVSDDPVIRNPRRGGFGSSPSPSGADSDIIWRTKRSVGHSPKRLRPKTNLEH